MRPVRGLACLASIAGLAGLAGGAACGDNAAAVPVFFKQTLDPEFRAEGVAIFDVDRDGVMDVVTDQFWYRGPDFAPVEIRPPQVYDVGIYSDSVGAWGEDIDGDGWTDLVVAPFPTNASYWYRNPEGGGGHWTAFPIAPPLATGMESPVFADLLGDGRRVLIAGDESDFTLAWYEPGPDPTAPWIRHAISEPGFGGAYRFSHGLGLDDVDGDGRRDVLTTTGWFQRTADRTRWPFHPYTLGADPCSNMFARDLDGDGRADLICPHPHTYGLELWRQGPDGTFAAQVIDDTISQLHALGLEDLDGDGAPELVTGKNYFAHAYGDPGLEDPALLVYYKLRPDGAGGTLVERHVIDDDSGVGRTMTTGDVDGDRRPDIVTTNKKGLHVFTQLDPDRIAR